MRKSKAYSVLFIVLVCFLAISMKPAAAQTTYGTILGNATDASGASVAGAAVTLISTGTQERRMSVSSDVGEYQFPNLVPGSYEVDFEKAGFAIFKRQGVVITVQASVRVDARLQVGDVTQTISIDTTMPILETQPGPLGQLVEGKQVQEMPLNGRNVFNLLILAPGASAACSATQDHRTSWLAIPTAW